MPIRKKRNKKSIFHQNELIKSTEYEKLQIINNQPCVLINHSVPLPIVLVEDKTNIVHTKALLFLHLFQSNFSPCIGCPRCKKILTIDQFSKHDHLDEEVENDDPNKLNISKQSFKILPYRINNESEMNESDLRTWKLFGKRFNYFKSIQLESNDKKSGEIETSSIKAAIKKKKNDGKTLHSLEEYIDLKNIEFNNWDKKVNDHYLLSKSCFESEQIYVVKKSLMKNENIHYFMEQKEDLLLSTDEVS